MTTPVPESNGSAPLSLSRRFRALIVGLIVARGVLELCVMPLFEGWDEYQHVAYVVHYLETGERAVFMQSQVPFSLLTAQREFPQSEVGRAQIPGEYQPEGYGAYWRGRAGGDLQRIEPAAESLGDPPKVWLYQAQHSWLYYAMVAPVFQALGGVEDLKRSVGGLRLVNLAFTAAAVWVALGVVASRVRNRRTAGWIALAIGLQPLLLMNGVRVSSDAPGVFLATLVVAQMMTLAIDDRRLVRRSCVLGLLSGTAIMMKATNFALLPVAGVCWLVALARLRPSIRVVVASALAVGLSVAAIVGPETRFNFATYGIATSMSESIWNHEAGRGLREMLQTLGGFSLFSFFHNIFGKGLLIAGGWSFIQGFPEITDLYSYSVHLALFGWAILLASFGARRLASRRRSGEAGESDGLELGGRARVFDSGWTPVVCFLICAFYAAGLSFHALQCLLARGTVMTGPWYAAPIIPWFLVLVIAGASYWPRFVAPVVVAAMLVASVAAEQTMLWVKMLPVYSGGASGLEAFRRITSLQPWYLTTYSCALAGVAASVLLATAVLSIARGRNGVALAADAAQTEAEPAPQWRIGLGLPWRGQPGRDTIDGPHRSLGQAASRAKSGSPEQADPAERV